MNRKFLWTVGFVAAGLALGAASCSERFIGCDKKALCPDASEGGQGGGGGDAGEDGFSEDTCDPPCGDDMLICREGTCVACDDEHPCSDGFCHPDRFECVACLEDAHCPGSAPVCDDGTCAGCTERAHCERFEETPVCHEEKGECVECTRETEEERCNQFTCSSLSHACTTTLRGNQGTCDPCEADSECAAGRRCVLQTFGNTDVGYFCFRDESEGGCGDMVQARRPYSTPTDLISIDGVPASYCMPPSMTTCQGIRDTQGKLCSMDDDCGHEGLDDGFCPTEGSSAGLCSYRCSGPFHCVDGLSCGDDPQHCRP